MVLAMQADIPFWECSNPKRPLHISSQAPILTQKENVSHLNSLFLAGHIRLTFLILLWSSIGVRTQFYTRNSHCVYVDTNLHQHDMVLAMQEAIPFWECSNPKRPLHISSQAPILTQKENVSHLNSLFLAGHIRLTFLILLWSSIGVRTQFYTRNSHCVYVDTNLHQHDMVLAMQEAIPFWECSNPKRPLHISSQAPILTQKENVSHLNSLFLAGHIRLTFLILLWSSIGVRTQFYTRNSHCVYVDTNLHQRSRDSPSNRRLRILHTPKPTGPSSTSARWAS
jgi:S-ribosylhomocysteine lyase LuxS involved in autoinducer biosynthesis